jgi:hypothetical protein
MALADPRYHQTSDGWIAPDCSISPDVEIANGTSRSIGRARAHGGVAIRIHALSFSWLRLCLPLLRGSASLRDRRCRVLVVTMAIVMVVSIGRFDGRVPYATSKGRIRPEGRLCLDRLPATAKTAFFPCREVAAFLAEDKKAV